MRTTITLEPDVEAGLKRLMSERRLTFKGAVNQAMRRGLQSGARRQRFATSTFDMGKPTVPLDKAMRLAADLEDEEIVRRLALRK